MTLDIPEVPHGVVGRGERGKVNRKGGPTIVSTLLLSSGTSRACEGHSMSPEVATVNVTRPRVGLGEGTKTRAPKNSNHMKPPEQRTRPDLPNVQGSEPLTEGARMKRATRFYRSLLSSQHISRPLKASSQRSDSRNGGFKHKGSLGVGEHTGAFSNHGR